MVIQENVRGSDLYVVQAAVAPESGRSVYDNLMMLLHAVEAAALADAERVTAVVPYYPSARQDKRKGRTREGISAGLVARMLQSAGASRVLTVEIHNEAISGMFDPARCQLENVYLHNHLAPWACEQGLTGESVVSPDVGGLERARRYAERLHLHLAAISKQRDYSRASVVRTSTLIGNVDGHDVTLVDDIVDTAGSVVAACEELKAHGAGDITVLCAHALLSDPAIERLDKLAATARQDGWKFALVGTSSVPRSQAPDWYLEYAIEPLLAKVITRLNTHGSVTGVQDET
jgi:ribose-phosphate pyrophosphokinase